MGMLPGLPAGAADNPAEVFELPTVTVVGNAPLPGIGIALKDMPANVQIWSISYEHDERISFGANAVPASGTYARGERTMRTRAGKFRYATVNPTRSGCRRMASSAQINTCSIVVRELHCSAPTPLPVLGARLTSGGFEPVSAQFRGIERPGFRIIALRVR
jgi:hypothetical protein